MRYKLLGDLTRHLGIYRQARWLFRRTLYREELQTEKNDLKFYRSLLTKNALVFDVGAKVGDKTRVFLKLCARVVAFEPQPHCREELESRCGNTKRLTVIQAALGPKKGTQPLYISSRPGSSSLVPGWSKNLKSVIQVRVLTLDEMIREHGIPDYIKMDAEGYEHEILKGLTQPIPLVSFEYHRDKIRDPGGAFDCIEYLATFGELLINATPAEDLKWLYPAWMSKDSFLEVFPDKIPAPESSHCGYGDIFVRVLT